MQSVQSGWRARWVFLVGLACASACAGGQSGTETPSGGSGGPPFPDRDAEVTTTIFMTPHCACALADESALLHVTLLELSDCRVRARVEERLAVASGLSLAVERGAELAAARVGSGGCTGEGLSLAAGDEALLVYAPPLDGGSSGSALVASWGSVHVFGTADGTEIALPAAERARLLDGIACTNWFAQPGHAAPPAEPDPGGGAACRGAVAAP